MDDLANEDILNATDDSTLHDVAERKEDSQAESPPTRQTPRSFRRGLFKAASLQDKILEKVISQMIPIDDGYADPDSGGADDGPSVFAARPGFTVTAMSNNFRRFNARIGVVFKFQARMIRLFSWRRPSQTLSFLAVYTFVCLNPYLLCVLPLALALFGILVPSFIARHPAPSSNSNVGTNKSELGYVARGPPLAPARTVKPVKELSRDFFRNMGDLQNSMEDFSVAHDHVVALVVPATNFSDEALSSAIFVLLFAASVVMFIAAHLLPWRFMALAGGWIGICSGHPAVAKMIQQGKKQYMMGAAAAITNAAHGTTGAAAGNATTAAGDGKNTLTPQQQQVQAPPVNPQNALASAFEAWVRNDIILDEAPETREVEIFELQRRTEATGGEWEAWLFSPSPYDPLSAPRIAGDRPRGTRFFEDVLPPEGGWEWSEKKWALDLWSREWVEERIITGVEVETEGERWVYDMFNENEVHAGVVEVPPTWDRNRTGNGSASGTPVSWEESEEGIGRRGEWRRRRWVRTVKRKNVTTAG